MKKFNILQFVRAIIFLSRGAVCYKLCRNLFLLFLTLFLNLEQHIAQATNLLFFVPSALVCIIINTKRKLINFKNAMFFIVFGVIGAVCGAVVSRDMPVTKLRKLFGVFLLFISAYEIYSYFKLYIKGKKRQY